MNLRETRTLLQVLKAIGQRQTVDDDTAAVWAGILEDVDPRDGMSGLKRIIQEQPDLFVKPGHVIAAAQQQRDERLAAERRNLTAGLSAEDSLRRWRQVQDERFNAPPQPPPPRHVESPFQEWERARRRAQAATSHPLITDLDRIEEMERARDRYKAALQAMIDNPTEFEESRRDVEAEEGV